MQDLQESFFSKIKLFLIKDNLCDKRFLVLFLLLKQKNLDVYEKYSRFRKRLNYQDYRLSVKELKLSDLVAWMWSSDFTFIAVTFLKCEIAGLYGFRKKNTVL